MGKIPLVLSLAFVVAIGLGARAEDKNPSNSDIMKKVNKGKNALHNKVGDELSSDKIEWENVQKMTKEYADLAKKLGKNEQSMGTKESWEKFTKKYSDGVNQLNEAAGKKDKDAAVKARDAVSKMCAACHKAHRE